MYEGDTPAAERRAAALSLDKDLLRELLGQEELRELIDPGALERVEADLQCRSEMTRATDRDGLHDVLRRVGDLTVDLVRRIVRLHDQDVKLSPKEYDLLRLMVQHAGKVLTHRFLLGELWDQFTDAQYLRVYVRQLRQKIETDPERPQFVLTETGIGYRLRAAD